MTRKEFLNVALLQATEEGIGIHLAKFADICIKWGQQHPHWISVDDELPPRSELNENISDAVITFGYYDDGLHFLVELNRYHYKDGQWLYSQAKYWMPFQHPKKGGEK